MWALGLFVICLGDRYLIKKTRYKKVIVFEILFLLLLSFIYLYSSKEVRIFIDTEKSYFVLVYRSKGLTKNRIPARGLFDRAITFKNDSIINLDYSLLNDNNVYVLEPKSWGGFKAKYLDTMINSNKIKIEMRSDDLPEEQRDSIFKKRLSTIVLSNDN